MTPIASPGLETAAARASAPDGLKPGAVKAGDSKDSTDIKLRFEQMLWAEMLSHAGLEKALTQGGGEAASAFSRYVVEAIAKDLAEKHPMGLTENVSTSPTLAAGEEILP